MLFFYFLYAVLFILPDVAKEGLSVCVLEEILRVFTE